jgi:hypothetical protein
MQENRCYDKGKQTSNSGIQNSGCAHFLQRRKMMEKPGKLGRKECNSDPSTVVIAMDIREETVTLLTQNP